MEQLIARAREMPGKMTYGTAGASSYQFLATEVLKDKTGAVLMHVPYKGGSGVLVDVVGGVLDFGVTIAAPLIGMENQHRIRILAVSSPARLPVLPDVPCFAEIAPLKGVNLQTWGMFFMHRQTPQPTRQALNEAIAVVVNQPGISEVRSKFGMNVPTPSLGIAQCEEFLRSERDLLRPLASRVKVG
jgi:tripartite-type tricarboxylate transporter receptor subunit TctC